MSHDLISEATVVRASTAKYVDNALVIQQAAVDVARDAHFIDLGTKTLLLEGQRTNDFTRSEELDNAAWTKTRCSISADALAAPDGATTADKIVEDSSNDNHHILRNTPALTDDTKSTFVFFAKADERSWISVQSKGKDNANKFTRINLSSGAIGTSDAGHTVRVESLGSSWYRISLTVDFGNGGTTPLVVVYLATGDGSGVPSYTGDGTSGLHVWGLQFEVDQPFASSYVPTVGSTVTRSADKISWPFTLIPQGMTVYVRFVEKGSLLEGGSKRLLQIGKSDDSNPRLVLFGQTATQYRLHHQTTGGSVTKDITGGAIGDLTEIRAVLFPGGEVQFHLSLNGGSESSSSKSAALALASTWSDQLIWLNSIGSNNVGFNAFQSVKIAPGVQTRAFMRSY